MVNTEHICNYVSIETERPRLGEDTQVRPVEQEDYAGSEMCEREVEGGGEPEWVSGRGREHPGRLEGHSQAAKGG